MNKGTVSQFFKGDTTHRFPKIVTLAVSSCVLVAMITIDASASGYSQGNPSNRTNLESTLTSTLSFSQLTGSAGRWHPWSPPANPVATSSAPPSTSSGTTTTSSEATTTTSDQTTTTSSTTTTADPPPTTTTDPPPTTTTTGAAPNTAYPIGTADSSEPSGYAPPSANALSGYSQSYVSDFTGTSIPSGWETYSGQPGGDAGAQFGTAHDVVGGGILSLNTWRDPAYGNEWVTGGMCQCGRPQTYGAFFVRSRVTGPGPTLVELLFPTVGWPPEIDFSETNGETNVSGATVHWASNNSQQQILTGTDLTQWHTWGVIWTPTSITYTLDGRVWGVVTKTVEIPNVPMTLDLQQQTWCSSGFACPSSPQSMQVDWVAEYTSN